MGYSKFLLAFIFILFLTNVFSVDISTCADLYNMAESSSSFTVTTNIDCAAYTAAGDKFGNAINFYGTLDGGNYTISNIYVNAPGADYVGGIFRTVNSVSNLTLQNVKIYASNRSYVGGLAGQSSGTITNVTVRDSNIFGNNFAGIVVGNSLGQVLNSSVYDSNISANHAVGGMVGRVYHNMLNPRVSNAIINGVGDASNAYGVGGVVGTIDTTNRRIDLNDSVVSLGNLYGTYFVGGAVGVATCYYCSNPVTMNRITVNANQITGNQYVGGLAGHFPLPITITDSNATVTQITGDRANSGSIGGLVGYANVVGSNLSFTGNISINSSGSTTGYIGGLVGRIDSGSIRNAKADVNIDTTLGSVTMDNVGGILGFDNSNTTITDANVVFGVIKGKNSVGGIAGNITTSIVRTRVTGTTLTGVGADTYYGTGGVAGTARADSRRIDLNDSVVNITTINGTRFTGGIVGVGWCYYCSNPTNVFNSSFTGSALNGYQFAGGIAGYLPSGTSLISNSTARIPQMTFSGSDPYYSGGVGGAVINITNSNFIGNIDVSKSSNTGSGYFGGIAGQANSISDSWADTNLNLMLGTYASNYVGGLVGNYTGNITSSYAKVHHIWEPSTSNGTNIGGLAGQGATAGGYIIDSNVTFNDINGGNSVGGLAGYTQGNILRTKVIGNTLSGTGADSYYGVGGLVGTIRADSGRVDLNYANVNITTINGTRFTGGIVGAGWCYYCSYTTNVFNSTFTGSALNGYQFAGGIAGWLPSGASKIYDSNARITRIYLSGSNPYYSGGVGGQAYDINNANFIGLIEVNKSSNSGDGYFGGLAGHANSISYSWADTNLNLHLGAYASNYVGGLVGNYTGNIDHSWVRVHHIFEPATSNGGRVGGLAGQGATAGGYISDSNAVFTDINGGNDVGGLVGYAQGNILRNKVTGTNVRGTGYLDGYSLYGVGGLVGTMQAGARSDVNDNVVDLNSVVATSGAGGLVGSQYCYSCSSSYWMGVNRSKADLNWLIGTTHVGGLVGHIPLTASFIADSNARIVKILATGSDPYHIAGLAGANAGDIIRSNFVGEIDVRKTSGSGNNGYIAGLSGSVRNIYSSWADTNINIMLGTFSTNYVGGLTGYYSGNITSSWARVHHIWEPATSNGGRVGGLAGYGATAGGYISDSNAMFTDINGGNDVGGLVGYAQGNILRNKVTGTNVRGAGLADGYSVYGVGGLVGTMQSGARSDVNDNSVDLNSVSGTTGVGGLVGSQYCYSCSSSYWMGVNRSSVRLNFLSGTNYIGGIFGHAPLTGTFISDSNARIPKITASGTDPYHVGGLCGQTEGDVIRSNFIGEIDIRKTSGSGNNGYIAGLCGAVRNISYSWADTNINILLGGYSTNYVGGLTGWLRGNMTYSNAILGHIWEPATSNGGRVGGLVGQVAVAGASISDSNVIFVDINGGNDVGGLVGYAQGNVLRSKVTGVNVRGTGLEDGYSLYGVGGLVGTMQSGARSDVNDCSVDLNSVVGLAGVGGIVGSQYCYSCSSSYWMGVNRSVARINSLIGAKYTGGIFGHAPLTGSFAADSNAIITRIYAAGSDTYNIGGVVGANAGDVMRSYFIGTIDVSKSSNTANGGIGGVAGSVRNVYQSYADTNIDFTLGNYSGNSVGGVAGSAVTINDSYVRAAYIKSTRSGSYTGGLVGYAQGNINHSYAAVADVNGYSSVGGLVGYFTSSYTVSNSFFVGKAKASSSVDNNILAGANGSVSNCYFNNTGSSVVYKLNAGSTTEQDPNAGSSFFKGNSTNPPFGAGVGDWNFSGIWYVWSNDYPKFVKKLAYYTSGIFISPAINLGTPKRFVSFDFNGNFPNGTDVNFQIRTADSNSNLSSEDWVGPNDSTSEYYNSTSTKAITTAHDFDSWMQWRAKLYTNDEIITPTIYYADVNTVGIGSVIWYGLSDGAQWSSFDYNVVSTNGGSVDWFYGPSTTGPWTATSMLLSGQNVIGIKAVASASIDANTPNISPDLNVSYSRQN